MTAQVRTLVADEIASLSSESVVVLEQSAEALAANDLTGGCSDGLIGLNDLAFQPLMVALGVVVPGEFRNRKSEHLLAKKIILSKHSDLSERTHLSANALRLGLRGDNKDLDNVDRDGS